MRVLLATRSDDKTREIRALLHAHTRATIVSLAELGLRAEPAEAHIECFETFRENALAKARYFLEMTGLPTIADDSGLVVDALHGEPGVRSKRFANSAASGQTLDDHNNAELLRRLHGVDAARRTARYVCAAALLTPDARPQLAVGTCAGLILDHARGRAGFGYDPLFFLPELDASFGELEPAEKNRRSHRARAFRALAALWPAAFG